jgi:hypothetical protein
MRSSIIVSEKVVLVRIEGEQGVQQSGRLDVLASVGIRGDFAALAILGSYLIPNLTPARLAAGAIVVAAEHAFLR